MYTLLTTHALISMQKQPERSLIIQNLLSTPALATLYYYNQADRITKKEKYYLDTKQISETITLPLNKTIHYMIETFYCTHKQCDTNCKSADAFFLGENTIIIEELDAPSIISDTYNFISISRRYQNGISHALYPYKKEDAMLQNKNDQLTQLQEITDK